MRRRHFLQLTACIPVLARSGDVAAVEELMAEYYGPVLGPPLIRLGFFGDSFSSWINSDGTWGERVCSYGPAGPKVVSQIEGVIDENHCKRVSKILSAEEIERQVESERLGATGFRKQLFDHFSGFAQEGRQGFNSAMPAVAEHLRERFPARSFMTEAWNAPPPCTAPIPYYCICGPADILSPEEQERSVTKPLEALLQTVKTRWERVEVQVVGESSKA